MSAHDRFRKEQGDPSLVRNASSERQVKRADRVLQRRQERERNDVLAVLGTPEGQRFIGWLMRFCRVPGYMQLASDDIGSIWEASARIHYNAGAQDVGLRILHRLQEAHPEAALQLMKAVRAADEHDAIENAAARTPSASESEEQE